MTAAPAEPALVLLPDAPPLRGYWSRSWQRLLQNRLAVAGLAIVALMVAMAVFAPIVAPHDPAKQDLYNTFASPSLEHPAGTDNLGRDWFSRIVYGARISLTVGIAAQLLVLGIGLPVGLIAGLKGRMVDSALMRLTDLAYGFPDLLLIILLRSVMGGGLFTLVLIIGLVSWMDTARLVRGQVLSLREREFVTAARSLGATDTQVMLRHLLPNLTGPVIVMLALGIPRAVFIEAALSFIGLGVSIGTPSWGSMVQEGYAAILPFPHLVLAPSIAIALLLLAFTFIGDGLRDALDPTLDGAKSKPLPQAEARRREAPSIGSSDLPKAA
jgi:oligopeptide transport system permease protein